MSASLKPGMVFDGYCSRTPRSTDIRMTGFLTHTLGPRRTRVSRTRKVGARGGSGSIVGLGSGIGASVAPVVSGQLDATASVSRARSIGAATRTRRRRSNR